MAENALLNVIRDAYAEKYQDNTTAVISHFCEFANDWLVKKGVVGLGQTTDGFAIRFADGSEHILATNTPTSVEPGMPVSITGLEARNQRTMPDTTRSVQITGN